MAITLPATMVRFFSSFLPIPMLVVQPIGVGDAVSYQRGGKIMARLDKFTASWDGII